MFIAGVLVFGLASLAAGLAPSSGVLVAARLFQGVGGGLLNPQVSGLIQELFSGRERGRAFGLLGATIGMSTAVGPVVGGLIIELLGVESGWRWIFFVNLPIAVAAVVLALRWLPARRAGDRARRLDLDPVGVMLLGLGVSPHYCCPSSSGVAAAGSRSHGGSASSALACLAGFVAWERAYTARDGSPLVDLALFRVPATRLAPRSVPSIFAGFTGIFFVLTIYFQEGLGYSPCSRGWR